LFVMMLYLASIHAKQLVFFTNEPPSGTGKPPPTEWVRMGIQTGMTVGSFTAYISLPLAPPITRGFFHSEPVLQFSSADKDERHLIGLLLVCSHLYTESNGGIIILPCINAACNRPSELY
jgi:hypothetical protein